MCGGLRRSLRLKSKPKPNGYDHAEEGKGKNTHAKNEHAVVMVIMMMLTMTPMMPILMVVMVKMTTATRMTAISAIQTTMLMVRVLRCC